MSFVELTRADDWMKRYPAEYSTPTDRYKVLAEVVASAGLGDTVQFVGSFEAGRYDQLDCSKLSHFGGYGPGLSDLLMTAQNDPDGTKPVGVAILLGPTTVVEHCTLQNAPANPGEDGSLIGIPAAGDADVTLRHVRLIGQDWTFFHWAAAGHGARVLVEDCEINFARQGLSQLGNNATKSVWTIRRTHFIGDANRSNSYGSSSGMHPDNGGVLAGVVFRAGLCEIEDCTFKLTGLAKQYNAKYGCPRIAAVTDHYHSASNKALRINVKNSQVLGIEPGTAVQVHDIDARFGMIDWDNEELIAKARGGSGESGELTAWK